MTNQIQTADEAMLATLARIEAKVDAAMVRGAERLIPATCGWSWTGDLSGIEWECTLEHGHNGEHYGPFPRSRQPAAPTSGAGEVMKAARCNKPIGGIVDNFLCNRPAGHVEDCQWHAERTTSDERCQSNHVVKCSGLADHEGAHEHFPWERPITWPAHSKQDGSSVSALMDFLRFDETARKEGRLYASFGDLAADYERRRRNVAQPVEAPTEPEPQATSGAGDDVDERPDWQPPQEPGESDADYATRVWREWADRSGVNRPGLLEQIEADRERSRKSTQPEPQRDGAKCESCVRLREELTNQSRNNHRRNVQLDALHYVWCNGGCEGGVHRYDHGELTQEIVDEAVRNTKRLVHWWINKGFKADWRELSTENRAVWMKTARELSTARRHAATWKALAKRYRARYEWLMKDGQNTLREYARSQGEVDRLTEELAELKRADPPQDVTAAVEAVCRCGHSESFHDNDEGANDGGECMFFSREMGMCSCNWLAPKDAHPSVPQRCAPEQHRWCDPYQIHISHGDDPWLRACDECGISIYTTAPEAAPVDMPRDVRKAIYADLPSLYTTSPTPEAAPVPDAPAATPSRPIGTLWLGPGGYVFVPTGGRPGIGVSGRDSVDTLCDIEQSTRGEPIAALPAEPEAPRCEGWCGGRYEEAHRTMPGKTVFFARWCSNACRTAGRALRPRGEMGGET